MSCYYADPALNRRPEAIERVIRDACATFNCRRRELLVLKTQLAVRSRRWAIKRLGAKGLASFQIAHYLNVSPYTVLKNLKEEKMR